MISRAQQRERVGARRGAHAGPQLLGHARAADDVAALEDLHVEPGARQVGGGDQAVVAGADDDRVRQRALAAAGRPNRPAPAPSSRSPCAAKAAATSSASRPAGRRRRARAAAAREARARAPGAAGAGGWRGTGARRARASPRRSTRANSTSTPLTARVAARRLDAERVVVDGDDRRPAELRGGDGQHARAAAEVEQRPAGAPARAAARGTAASSAWAPVPNAWPGSMTDLGHRPARAASHGGRTRRRARRPPRAVEAPPALGPVVGDLARSCTSTSASPAAACRSGSSGSSPGAP